MRLLSKQFLQVLQMHIMNMTACMLAAANKANWFDAMVSLNCKQSEKLPERLHCQEG